MTTQYAPHQQRVLDEKADLDAKITKLHEFIESSEIYASLPTAEKGRLLSQRTFMNCYSSTLGDRIAAF